jgi:hypothetical protein
VFIDLGSYKAAEKSLSLGAHEVSDDCNETCHAQGNGWYELLPFFSFFFFDQNF